MKNFPIKFSFAAVDYAARVTAYGQNSQFHISGFIPQISGIELPFVIHKKRSSSDYSWTVDKNHPTELGEAIFEAIKKSQKL